MEQNTTQDTVNATLHSPLYPSNRKSCFFTPALPMPAPGPGLDLSQRCTTGKWGDELFGCKQNMVERYDSVPEGPWFASLMHLGELQSF